MRFGINLLFVSSYLLPSLLGQSVEGSTNPEDYLFKFTNETSFEAWSLEVEKAVKDLQENGTDRRIGVIDKIYMVLSGLFAEGVDKLKCEACKVGIGAGALITHVPFTKSLVVRAVGEICQVATKQPKSVCEGIAASSGAEVYDVLYKIDRKNPYVRQVACVTLGNLCPFPDIPVSPLSLPKPTSSPVKDTESSNYKYILHLSDLHFDAEYNPGSEADCNKPICCQKDSNSDLKDQTVKRGAGKWGDYKCDAPKVLLESLLKNAIKLTENLPLEMIVFTGDVPAHDFWKESVGRSQALEKTAYGMLNSYLLPQKNKLYPAIGNHESVPANQFAVDGKSDDKLKVLYKFIAEQWKSWLPSTALTSINKGGYYSIQHNKNLKVISLNNNLCYMFNFQLFLDPSNSDINNMLKWLVNELDSAEKSGSKVYIISHIPPGSIDCFKHWSLQYNLIIQRYSTIISGQFFGHEHTDEFEINYLAGKPKSLDTAISNSYLAPSMSTLGGHNPSFRLYKIDTANYKVVDYLHYYAELKESSKWTNDAEWKLLYSAKDAYNPNYTGKYLDAKFWHDVTTKMESDDTIFNKFYQFRNSKGIDQEVCDKNCKNVFICNLRAGYSGDSCTQKKPFDQS